MNTPTVTIIDIAIIAAVSAVVFVLEDLAGARGWLPFAEEARGAFTVVIGAVTAVSLVLARGGSLTDLGFKRPKRWAPVPFQVAAILLAFVAAQFLLPLLVSAFISVPQPDLSRYDSIAGNLAAAIFMALILPLTASIPEEIIYRGFLIGRLTGVFGSSAGGACMAVLIQALIFGGIHFQWGLGGMITTVMMGIIWGTAYLLCDRNLWVVILAHSAGHILLVVQLYQAKPLII